MCSPAAAVAGVQGASAVADYFGGRRLAAQQTSSLFDSFGSGMAGFAERGEQINRSAKDQMSERAKAALVEQGRLRAMGGDGASGQSWERLFARSEAALGRDLASIEVNRSAATRQNTRDAMEFRAQVQSNLNQVRRPTLLSLAGGIAGATGTYAQLGGKLPKVPDVIWKSPAP
jgi:hypothetical protein